MFTKFFLILFLICVQFHHENTASEEETVEKWAATLGRDLWELGLNITKAMDIKTTYKKMNARVLPTDGEGILATIVSNLNRLLKIKMDSVMCVIDAAEDLAEEFVYDPIYNYTYFSAKHSPEKGVIYEVVEDDEELILSTMYKEMALTSDNHFYGIAVNTSHSAVHVPTDVYDQSELVESGLQWSEGLDNIFMSNYMSDPTMSWQYFGSSAGFLRHYPAFHWGHHTDTFDCRTRFWFIEAATCSKDIVILFDNSGSMTGMRNTIARLTVNTILDTFSSNDFINIFSFNKTTKAVIPCFPSDLLVQATRENNQRFKEAVSSLEPDDKADFPKAFAAAFNLLEKARENKSCPDDICNQAIMLITDGVPDNLTEVFEKYNWFENHTRIPVRVFTYLIGKEVTNVREIQYMACLNRGYYVHIHSLEEVRNQVLKYISVIARPLVLQAVEHPLTWTHTFLDVTGYVGKEEQPVNHRFMTSVSGPAFDRRRNNDNNTRMAELLGIAGTDVLIRDIKSLTLPYKIGANGYAFVITNNGYLLFHPDLRPTYDGVLLENYNSIDLTEVELLDDENYEPRNPSPEILQLREAMVNHEEGNITNLKIKFHYDNMRRVGAETRHYYYAPLKNTPFTVGLVLPHSYGNYWIKAGDEIKKTLHLGKEIVEYFKGNWRVHPDWVYCNYHRSREEWTPEEMLEHFLRKISLHGWKWKDQFPPETDTSDEDSYNCNRPIVEDNEYYCDQELMQLLVFDARSTESYNTKEWIARSRSEVDLAERYGVSVRFVATQSGLTRWQDIAPSPNETQSWGERNPLALDEVWYKSAVLHHHIDAEAFVFSVPFDAGGLNNIEVTASYAIFPRDGGLEAPGSVVGFTFQHSTLFDRFVDITSRSEVADHAETCASDELDCYVIDGNGYVVLSETRNDTGRFFGEMEGAVMDSMVSKNIFREIPMFDYQAFCYNNLDSSSGVEMLWTPFKHISTLLTWSVGKLVWLMFETTLWPYYTHAETDPDYYDEHFEIKKQEKEDPTPVYKFVKRVKEPKPIPEACDRMGNLYLLQHLSKEGYHSAVPVNCSRPFYVKRIPHTNLLLVVVNTLHQSCYRKLSSNMERIEYNASIGSHPSCQKLNINALPRRRLSGCFNTHPLEEEINICGESSMLHPNTNLQIFTFIFILLFVNKIL